MEALPIYVTAIFLFATLLTAILFYQASNKSKITLGVILLWLCVQGVIGITGFYTHTATVPPRLMLLVLPPFLLITALLFSEKGRSYISSLNPKTLTYLHVVRIPVEATLYWLFISTYIPQLMTFEGRNFDILAGVTAPIVAYFGYNRKQLSSSVLLAWNLVCLGLLINIVYHGILSVPTPFQRFGFDQPNIALTYFPFIWLPGFIVPVVMLSHTSVITQILEKRKSGSSYTIKTA